jgi:ATP-binding cassette, subfamily B, bacterial
MFARNAELLVFDDLSSALDVETERTLWERLDERRTANDGVRTLHTCLVVSHRRAALRRADHILVLEDGRLEACRCTKTYSMTLHSEPPRMWQRRTSSGRRKGLSVCGSAGYPART